MKAEEGVRGALDRVQTMVGRNATPVRPLLLTLPADRRLLRRVRRVGTWPSSSGRLGWYRFEWNRRAERLYGLRGPGEGLLADEVRRVQPDAVGTHPVTGHLHLDGQRLLLRLSPR